MVPNLGHAHRDRKRPEPLGAQNATARIPSCHRSRHGQQGPEPGYRRDGGLAVPGSLCSTRPHRVRRFTCARIRPPKCEVFCVRRNRFDTEKLGGSAQSSHNRLICAIRLRRLCRAAVADGGQRRPFDIGWVAGFETCQPENHSPGNRSPFQERAKKRNFQSELPTGRAEVLSITGSAGAHGGQASTRFRPDPRERASALVISRKTKKGRLA